MKSDDGIFANATDGDGFKRSGPVKIEITFSSATQSRPALFTPSSSLASGHRDYNQVLLTGILGIEFGEAAADLQTLGECRLRFPQRAHAQNAVFRGARRKCADGIPDVVPFVERYRARGGESLIIHEAARLGWRRRLAQRAPNRFRELSVLATALFTDPAAPSRIEAVYHLLSGDPDLGANELNKLFREWNGKAGSIGRVSRAGPFEGDLFWPLPPS